MKLNNNNIEVFFENITFKYFKTKVDDTLQYQLDDLKKYPLKKSINSCYKKPSKDKIEVWAAITDFYLYLIEKKFSIISHGIQSYNSFQFTYAIYFKAFDNIYKFYITRDNNYLISDKKGIKKIMYKHLQHQKDIKNK